MAPVRWCLSALAVFTCLALLQVPARGQGDDGWIVCNQTSYIVKASTARPEGQRIIAEGWTKLRPGRCETVLAAPLTPGLHFLFAHSSRAHLGGTKRWGGEKKLCVDPTGSFSVETPPDCASYGLQARQFRPVLIEDTKTWKTTLTETNEYSMESAEAAGVQRLLEDAGVFSGRVDGVLGRKTRAAIGAFLEDNDLPSDTSDADLIDLLEQASMRHGREVGFSLCNRTEKRIWGAIARPRGDSFESRGWWQLEPGGCARVIDEPLVDTDYFVYGEMQEEDGRVRTLKRASDGFCVSRAKFAIKGRDDCEAAAYRTALFTAAPRPKAQKLVFEFFERDFDTPREAGDG